MGLRRVLVSVISYLFIFLFDLILSFLSLVWASSPTWNCPDFDCYRWQDRTRSTKTGLDKSFLLHRPQRLWRLGERQDPAACRHVGIEELEWDPKYYRMVRIFCVCLLIHAPLFGFILSVLPFHIIDMIQWWTWRAWSGILPKVIEFLTCDSL